MTSGAFLLWIGSFLNSTFSDVRCSRHLKMLTANRKQIGEEKKEKCPSLQNMALCLTGPLSGKWHRFASSFSAVLADVISMSVTLLVLTCCHALKGSCSPSVARSALSEPFSCECGVTWKVEDWLVLFFSSQVEFSSPIEADLCFVFSLVFLLAKVNFMPPPLLFLNEKLQLTTHWNGATCQRGCTSTLCSIFFFLPTQRNIMCFCVSFSERPFSDFIPKFSSNCCGNIQCCFFFFFCIVEVLFFNCIFETLFACTFCKACLKSLFCYVAITQTLNMNSDNCVCVWIISVYLNTSIRE